MKNIVKIITVAWIVLYACSCNDDYLDVQQKSTMDDETVFSNPGFARDVIGGILDGAYTGTTGHRNRFTEYYGSHTDVEVHSGGIHSENPSNMDPPMIANYYVSPTNLQLNVGTGTLEAYSNMFQGIERCNLALVGLRKYGDIYNPSNWEMRQIYGEILTHRAIFYGEVLKAWGNVPARFEPITTETMYLERSDRDVVLKQLLADLEEAADYVGWPKENSYTQSYQHITKALVKALRARFALWAGGYSMHVYETEMRMSDDADLERTKMYTIARDECLDVIKSGTARLQPQGAYSTSFENLWRVKHLKKPVAGDEHLWEIPYAIGRGQIMYAFAIRHAAADKYVYNGNGGRVQANPMLFYKFKPEDVRRNLTVVPYAWNSDVNQPAETRQPYQDLPDQHRWSFAKMRFEWALGRIAGTDDGYPPAYMRYANVLLMAAEAINELEGPDAAAPYLRQIKERAYPDHPAIADEEMAEATASKEAFFNAVVDERAKELAGEMFRKEDLIRWNKLTEKLRENSTELEKFHNRNEPYDVYNPTVYYKDGRSSADGITIQYWGLEAGETGPPPGGTAGWATRSWNLPGSGTTAVTPYWKRNGFRFRDDPSLQPYWPIWQYLLDASDGKLVNDPVFKGM